MMRVVLPLVCGFGAVLLLATSTDLKPLELLLATVLALVLGFLL
jgi:hypothetical protein